MATEIVLCTGSPTSADEPYSSLEGKKGALRSDKERPKGFMGESHVPLKPTVTNSHWLTVTQISMLHASPQYCKGLPKHP